MKHDAIDMATVKVADPPDEEVDALTCEACGRIQKRRLELGMTGRDFAARVGIAQSYVSRIESGQHGLSIALLGRLAAGLEWSVIELLQPDARDLTRANRALESMLRVAQQEVKPSTRNLIDSVLDLAARTSK